MHTEAHCRFAGYWVNRTYDSSTHLASLLLSAASCVAIGLAGLL